MKTRQTILLALGLVFATACAANAQTNNQNTFTKGNSLPTNDGAIVSKGMSPDHFIDSPMKSVFGSNFMVANAVVERETRNINIGPAVAAYARLMNVDLQQARYDALEYLGAVHTPAAPATTAHRPQFKPLSADRFEVTAPVDYFKSLPARIRSFELGKKSIVVTIEYIDLDDRTKEEVTKFLLQDSIQHVNGRVPDVSPELPAKSDENDLYRASSILQVSKSMPLTIGQLDFDNYERLIKLVKSRSNCSVMSSPTVVAHPGQDAYVTDGTMRPFVVGVKQVQGDTTMAHQPVIQLLEDGNFFRVNCRPVNDKIQLDCSFAFAEVVNQESLTMRSFDNGNQVSVQTPSHHVRSVNLSAELATDRVLLVDPYHIEVSESNPGGKKRLGKTKLRKHHVLALIRAKVISDQ